MNLDQFYTHLIALNIYWVFFFFWMNMALNPIFTAKDLLICVCKKLKYIENVLKHELKRLEVKKINRFHDYIRMKNWLDWFNLWLHENLVELSWGQVFQNISWLVCLCCFVLLGTRKILSLGEFDKCNLFHFYYLFLT